MFVCDIKPGQALRFAHVSVADLAYLWQIVFSLFLDTLQKHYFLLLIFFQCSVNSETLRKKKTKKKAIVYYLKMTLKV